MKSKLLPFTGIVYDGVEYNPIRDFPDYFASRDGVVIGKYGRPMKTQKGNDGRWYVKMQRDGRRVTTSVARVIAAAWLHDFSDELQVHHIDGDGTNDTVENLECLSRRIHCAEHGHGHITKDAAREIHRIYDTGAYTVRDIGEIYGVYNTHVSEILTGRKHADVYRQVHGVEPDDRPTMKDKEARACRVWDLHKANPSMTHAKIAKKTGMGRSTVTKILLGKNWPNLHAEYTKKS